METTLQDSISDRSNADDSLSRHLLLLGVACCFVASCATPRTMEIDEQVVHFRDIAGVAQAGGVQSGVAQVNENSPPAFIEAELSFADNRAPSLELFLVDRLGERRLLSAASEVEARTATQAVLKGANLADVLPDGLQRSLVEAGFGPLPSPAEGQIQGESWALQPPLQRYRLHAEKRDDDRYGNTLVFVLRSENSEPGVELARAPWREDSRLRLRVLSAERTVVTVAYPKANEGLTLQELLVIDTAKGAALITEAQALTAHARKAWDEALKLLREAEQLAPHVPSINYNTACVLARAGRPEDALISLGRAIELSPTLYRMLARNDEDLASLRTRPEFSTLTATRQLPGTNRVASQRK